MKRREGDYLIEGDYNPKRYFNYFVYNLRGERPYEVQGTTKPFWIAIIFEKLKDARRWIKDGCRPIKYERVVWAAHSDAVLKKLEKEKGESI